MALTYGRWLTKAFMIVGRALWHREIKDDQRTLDCALTTQAIVSRNSVLCFPGSSEFTNYFLISINSKEDRSVVLVTAVSCAVIITIPSCIALWFNYTWFPIRS